MDSINTDNTRDALTAHSYGYQPIPIRDGGKNPHISAWTHITWDDTKKITEAFDEWRTKGASGVGVVLEHPRTT